MTYIKIKDTLYPATISGEMQDRSWDNRDSKTITLAVDHSTAASLFVDNLIWSIVYQPDDYVEEETGETIAVPAEEYDNSEYCVAGTITDNRDGTLTVKMGKRTDKEMLEELLGVLNND